MSAEDGVRAYALKESVEDFAGGSCALGSEGESIDLGKELEAGDGFIVTADPAAILSLSMVDLLEQVDPEGRPVRQSERAAFEAAKAEEQEGQVDPAKHSKDELLSLAADAGVPAEDVTDDNTKAEIADAINAANAEGAGA